MTQEITTGARDGLVMSSVYMSHRNAGDKGRMWTFGGGVRKCIGNFLSNAILKVCKKLLT